jgi:hypothetical protein
VFFVAGQIGVDIQVEVVNVAYRYSWTHISTIWSRQTTPHRRLHRSGNGPPRVRHARDGDTPAAASRSVPVSPSPARFCPSGKNDTLDPAKGWIWRRRSAAPCLMTGR